MVFLFWAGAGVVLASLMAIAGLLYVHRSPRLSRHLGQNDVAGILFGAVGVLYGALLAFVVFATWESYSRAEQAVVNEAANLVVAYRDTQEFPEPQRTEIQAAMRTYATTVMASEWVSHGTLAPHTTPDLLNPIWDLYRQMKPTDPMAQTELASAEDRLHQVELQRHLRHLSGESTLPDIFWVVLVIGSVLVVIFSYVFHQDNVRVQVATTGLFAALLTLVLVLIYSLNQPFTGPFPVSQQPLQHALLQFDAIDLPASP